MQKRLTTIRYLLSEIKNAEIDAKKDLDDSKIEEILLKEVKKRKDSIVQFREAARADLADEEESKLIFIEPYLPEQMSVSDIEAVVTEVIAEIETDDFGKVMGMSMTKLKGKAAGGDVSMVVKKLLNKV